MSSSYSSDFYTLDDITYEITVVDGTWESLYGEYGTLIKNSPWWGDEDLATDLSKEFGKTLGKFGDAAAGISAPYYYTLFTHTTSSGVNGDGDASNVYAAAWNHYPHVFYGYNGPDW